MAEVPKNQSKEVKVRKQYIGKGTHFFQNQSGQFLIEDNELNIEIPFL
jgi:UPF0176 protein